MSTVFDATLLEQKIDIVRNAITSLETMTDQQFIDLDYWNQVILMNGGIWFAEGIAILRGNPRKLVEKQLTVLDHLGQEIVVTMMVESDDPEDLLPVTRLECLNHMKNAISILLVNRWVLG